jgi:hypothetical protein
MRTRTGVAAAGSATEMSATAATAKVAATTTARVAAASPATTVLGESRMRGDGEGGSERKCGKEPERRTRAFQ